MSPLNFVLQLHCTVLNTSKRKPAKLRGSPFCYSDVLASRALRLLVDASVMDSTDGDKNKGRAHGDEYEDAGRVVAHGNASKSKSTKTRVKRAPVHVNLSPRATVDVEEIGLWIMGSRGPNNEYISCGGVGLGWCIAVDAGSYFRNRLSYRFHSHVWCSVFVDDAVCWAAVRVMHFSLPNVNIFSIQFITRSCMSEKSIALQTLQFIISIWQALHLVDWLFPGSFVGVLSHQEKVAKTSFK